MQPGPDGALTIPGHCTQRTAWAPRAPDGALEALLARCWAADLADPESPVAVDPESRALYTEARRAAASNATVLVSGPSGAGKDVLATYLHAAGPRAAGPFVAVNCAALPEAMLEALMFGHQRGAFTGAVDPSPGLVRAAHGGTLFLDELGELPRLLQAKLLRVLEAREVLPVGATRPVPVDIRVIAATNRDLAADVADGAFRSDLYWRLAVFPLHVPPLAERPADILPLIARLWQRLATGAPAIEAAALARLIDHGWPGNVRELANVLQRALILSDGGPVRTAHLRFDEGPKPVPEALAASRCQSESASIARALAASGGRRADAARRLGISERTLRYKLAAAAGRPRTRTAGVVLQ